MTRAHATQPTNRSSALSDEFRVQRSELCESESQQYFEAPERCEVDAGFVNQVLDVASVKVRQKCDAVLDVGSCRQVGWQLADKMNVGS